MFSNKNYRVTLLLVLFILLLWIMLGIWQRSFAEVLRYIYDDPYKQNIIYTIPKGVNLEVFAPMGWYKISLEYKLPLVPEVDIKGWVYIR